MSAAAEAGNTLACVAPWLIVGLGNPGPKYAGNRHNVGAMAVHRLVGAAGSSLRVHKSGALAANIRLDGEPTVAAVPSSFMNESGGPVSALMRFFKVPPERLIVIHDELDIDFGTLRLKQGGGEGGHNGLRSITAAIGTRDYFRVRVGVGRPPGRMDPAAYVLKDFTSGERKDLDLLLTEATDAAQLIQRDGLVSAQNIVHAR